MQSIDIYKMQMIEKIKEMIIGKYVSWPAKDMVKSAYKPSGPSGRSLSRFP